MPKDFLELSVDFFKKYWLDISLASLGIFFIIMYIIINNVEIIPPRNLKRGRTIVLEPLENRSDSNEMLKKGFCNSNKQAHTLDKNCNKLSEKSCNAVMCCVYAHNSESGQSKCVAGDGFNGPTYKGDANGIYYPYDYWYYLGKKHM